MTLTNRNSKHAYFKNSAALTLAIALHSLLLLGQSKVNKSDLVFNTPTTISSTEFSLIEESNLLFETKELSINTSAFEYASCLLNEELIVVSKRKLGSTNRNTSTILDQSDYKLISFSKLNDNWSQPQIMPSAFMGKENHGGITFSKEQTRVFYTKAAPERPHTYQLFTAEKSSKSSTAWRNQKTIFITSKNFSVENPWLSSNGKTIYFSSDMPGGYGGYDLYTVSVYKDGNVSKPVNLGPLVNSDSDEKYPSLNPNNTKLYFASNRKNGYGGFDLFQSFTSAGDYSNALNLGGSINTKFDEIAFISVSDTTGFFSSTKNALSKNPNIYSYRVKP